MNSAKLRPKYSHKPNYKYTFTTTTNEQFSLSQMN